MAAPSKYSGLARRRVLDFAVSGGGQIHATLKVSCLTVDETAQ
ncbi:hypothetical protein [Bythopirellula polymerisocia]|nr:hypothetical protein [Bythopirellula polymerisocia]